MSHFAPIILLPFLLLCAALAAHLQSHPFPVPHSPSPVPHSQFSTLNSPSPQADLVIALLGGFRSIAAEVVWFRTERLQDSGRYAELAQLAAWLTFLEPHTPEVWSYAAWNLAYNVSVMMPTPEDRWRWVEAGLKLLRDDGLRLNPGDGTLHREIAWLFLAKIGGSLDDASPYYRSAWKGKVESARASGDWSGLKLDPALMSAIDSDYGKQDWTHPYASSLYWAHRGLSLSTDPLARRELRHLLVQSLMLECISDASKAPRTLAEMRAAYAEFPSRMLEDMMARFRAKFPNSEPSGR